MHAFISLKKFREANQNFYKRNEYQPKHSWSEVSKIRFDWQRTANATVVCIVSVCTVMYCHMAYIIRWLNNNAAAIHAFYSALRVYVFVCWQQLAFYKYTAHYMSHTNKTALSFI